MTIRNLIEKFPTLVMVPQARECFLLQWYAEYEGNQVIVATSEAAAVQLFERAFIEHGDIEPKKFFKATFVSPPLDLQVANAQQAYENMLTNFKSHLEWVAKDLPKGHGLPKCTKYTPGDDYTYDEDLVELHIGCSQPNCYGGVIIDPDRFEELCWAEHDRKAADELSRRRPGKTQYPVASQAPNPSTLDVVYVAMANYGHHCSGLTLNALDDKDYRGFGKPEYMFFFQGESLPIPKAITTFIEADKKAQKDREAEAQTRRAELKAKQAKEEENAAIKLFGLQS